MRRWLPSLRWDSAVQSDDRGDWSGGYVRLEWLSFSAELQLTRLDARWRA